jgi:hypothetical protein
MAGEQAYISGVGQSQIGMKLTRHPMLLMLDAVREAGRSGPDDRTDRRGIHLSGQGGHAAWILAGRCAWSQRRSLGFCAVGEGGRFIEGGTRIALLLAKD